jgi:DUF1680 family protein
MKNINMVAPLLVAAIISSCQPKTGKDPVLTGDELTYRLDRVVDRITTGELPRITKDFLLAGLTLDPEFERRFTNYSGDQEGRYLSAMSLIDSDRQSIDIHELVTEIIATQKTDGRFGADTLLFDAISMEGPQMALLWGNGRLLTGLMDFYAKYPDRKDALASAQKLGDFLDGVTYSCTRPEIISKFKTMGAMGFICFTQITEGMVKLYNATGIEKYRKVAEVTYPLLPEFGNQHSHGFLNTLRGVVMLYEATGNPVHLHYAEQIFDSIVASENYLVTGGVPEFFGFHASADGVRDEGCSEADFFMLCIQLWKATGNNNYLDKGEYLLTNHMLYNQFHSGDFGHHVIQKDFGFITSHFPGQSWWCCNYHGLQALYDARAVVVTQEENIRKINLFYPTAWQDNEISFTLTRLKESVPVFQLVVNTASGDSARLAIRNPYWSSHTAISMNGEEAEVIDRDGYLHINRNLNKGDKIIITLHPSLRLVGPDRKEISLSELTTTPVDACMIYGPWLLSVDDVFQNLFMTELSAENIIYIDRDNPASLAPLTSVPAMTFNPEAYLAFTFLKQGTSQTSGVILRPIAEASFQGPSHVRYWLKFAKWGER